MTSRASGIFSSVWVLLASVSLASAEEAIKAWDLPPPGSCRAESPDAPMVVDAPPFAFSAGDVLTMDDLPRIRQYLPDLLWGNRDQFFFEGMRFEIGACFADYSPPQFYLDASEKFRGKARLAKGGGLEGAVAGLPFAPVAIAMDDPDAGLKWAWNYALRYQAAGFQAKFRIMDMVGSSGRAEPFEGEIYRVQLAHRADLAKTKYRVKGSRNHLWVAGGKMSMPFNARNYAWRQFRALKTQTSERSNDDLHAYIHTARRVRRMSGAYMEGLYMPSFSVGVSSSPMAAGASAGGAAASNPETITPKRSGWEGLEIRPNRSSWRVLGVQNVLTPINAITPMYPDASTRNFGPWGLSFGNDRWDLRRAIVIEAKYKAPEEEKKGVAKIVLHIDLQTLAPLYYQSWDAREEVVDVGIYLGRWSEDRVDYPRWPDDPKRPIRVIDPAGAAFSNVSLQVAWRRESWQATSTPQTRQDERNKMSVTGLTKGR